MATLIWTNATADGDFTTPGNWIDTSTGSPYGSALANSDTCIFDRGAEDVTAGLTTGLTGITLIGTDGYKGSIAPGSVLSIACANIRWGAGSINQTGSVTGSTVIANRPGTVVNINGGTHANLIGQMADINVAAAAVVTNGRFTNSNVVLLDNATDMTICQVRGPRSVIKCYRDAVYNVGEHAVVHSLQGSDIKSGSVIEAYGKILHTAGTDITDILIHNNGELDARQSGQTFTLTTLNRYPGGRALLDTKAGTVVPGTENIYGISDSYSLGQGTPV